MMRIRPLWLLALLAASAAAAQAPLLTPEEAVQTALAQNYDIRLASADVAIARLNNTKANAGILPTVNLVANETATISAFDQKLANGNEFSTLGAVFNTANAGVQLNWTLFDGRRMYITKRRLEALEALGEQNLRNSVQNTTATVLQAYYDVVRSRMQEKASGELIALNEERLRIAEARLAAGFAAQTDALQARIDLNQRKADLLLQQVQTKTVKILLNRLLVRAPETDFRVVEAITQNYTPQAAALGDRALTQNGSLLALQSNAEVSALAVEEAAKLNAPRISGLGQLSATRSDNGAGFLKSNTQAGLSIGAGLLMPLYTGGNLKRQKEVATLQAEQAKLRVEQQKTLIAADVDTQIGFFEAQKQVLALEEDNVRTARESLSVSLERFRVGTTNGLEPQTAQNTLEQALSRRDLVLYNLKVTELRLRLLSGEL
jgi:outer membrane protein